MSILSKPLNQLASTVVLSKSTRSEYYVVGCIKIRISDHFSSIMDCDLAVFFQKIHKHNYIVIIPMIGVFKEVQWFTSIDAAIDFISNFESMARLLVKRTKQTSVEAEALFTSKTEKLSVQDWNHQLQFAYTCKECPVNDMLDDLYKLNGTQDMVDTIKKCGPSTPAGRLKYIEELYVREKEKANR